MEDLSDAASSSAYPIDRRNLMDAAAALVPPARMTAPTRRAWAGIAGPTAFIAAWATLGALRGGYSPVNDPISQLAAIDAPSRPFMTAGLVVFAASMCAYAPVLRTRFSRGAAGAAVLTAAATVGIAALPLGGRGGDVPHGLAAGAAYASLAAVPLLAGRAQLAGGHRGAAAGSIATGMAVAATLAASVALPYGTGLAQRVGLTIGDVWIMSSAVAGLRSEPPSCQPRGRARHGRSARSVPPRGRRAD
jgi:hypothetical protein